MRTMIFVDGENLTFRAQQFKSDNKLRLKEGCIWQKDSYLWHPQIIKQINSDHYDMLILRTHYYTSIVGDTEKINEALFDLKNANVEAPKVLKKHKERGSKGVDISLTTEMLSHCFRDTYEYVFLFAGDGDYIPLIEEVKRQGKRVFLFFVPSGLSAKLQLAADEYLDISPYLFDMASVP